jgi:hypothetical protein
MPYYRLGRRHQPERDQRRRHRRRRSIIVLILLLLALGAWWAHSQLKPNTVIHQAKAVKTSVAFDTKTKTYNEGDFTIQIAASFTPVPRPAGPYKSFTWQTSDSGTNGQQIEIFEDTIPAKFAVNRTLIVEGEVDHIKLDDPVSDHCERFTRTGTGDYGQVGFLAKWLDVTFLCDPNNPLRDIIGTSSADGVNTVVLRTGAGVSHQFFFTYRDQQLQPDYSVFYNALQSFQMN